MKSWLFGLFIFIIAVCTGIFLLFLEQKFHIKQSIMEKPNGWVIIYFFALSLIAVAIIAIRINSGLVNSPVFLGFILGLFCFVLQKTPY